MERVAEFDLARALGEWRAGFTHLAGNELDELADHLREEFSRLAALGLAQDEAWLIARRRLGERPALEDEFVKLDENRRVFTFLLGFFAVGMCLLLARFVLAGVLSLSGDMGTLPFVTVSAGCSLVASLVLVRSLPRLAQWLPERALRSPGPTLLALFAGFAAFSYGESQFYVGILATPDHLPRFIAVQASIGFLLVGVVLLTLWIAARHRRRHRRIPQGLWTSRVCDSQHRV